MFLRDLLMREIWRLKRPAEYGNKLSIFSAIFFISMFMMLSYNIGYADGWLPGTGTGDISKADNEIKNNTLSGDGLRIGGIANTRHNLTMSYNNANGVMNRFRNNYYEICVYCHTPHGANSTAAAPLWNRTITQRNYVLYNQDRSTSSNTFFEPTALDLNYSQPGPNSLTCLSCHDGATAIDSIINMPTQLSGEFRAGYSKSQEKEVDSDFLDKWSGNQLGMGSPGDPGSEDVDGRGHAGFNSAGSFCLSCHNATTNNLGPDFTLFVIGDRYSARNDATGELAQQTNYLADDHPIGVRYPTDFGPEVDYREPDVKTAKIAYFDNNANGHADPEEVRLYDTGDGYEVECGSCHDPHGVKVTTEQNNAITPSFLRVGVWDDGQRSNFNTQATSRSNPGSSLCLTCHVK